MSNYLPELTEKYAFGLIASVRDLQDGFLFDCKVKVGEKEFPAHIVVLAASSEYFKEEFRDGKREIILKDVEPETVKQCIELIYGQYRDEMKENMEDILQVLSKHKVHRARDFFFDCIERNLTVENCLITLKNAQAYGYSKVIKSAEQFLTKNFEALFRTKNFSLLSEEDFVHLIKASEAGHKNTWKAILKWSKGQDGDKLTVKLLKAINIQDFPFELLMRTVWEEPKVKAACKTLVIETLFSDLERLKKGLTINNCFLIRSFNGEHNIVNNSTVQEIITAFMADNLGEISSKEKFMLLSLKELVDIFLDSKRVSVVEKWKAMINWIKHDDEREFHLEKLLEVLSIGTFPFNYLVNVVWSEKLVQKSKHLREVVAKIMFSDKNKVKVFINVNNCFLLREINSEHNSVNREEVGEMLQSFMADSLEEIWSKQELLSLAKNEVSAVMENTEASKMIRWQTVVRWIKHEKAREIHLLEMMNTARVDELPFGFLVEKVFCEPLIQNSKAEKLQVAGYLLSDLQRLQININRTNCLILKEITEEYPAAHNESARKIINSHLMLNLENFCGMLGFLDLTFKSFVSILESPEAVIKSDSAKWQAVLNWVKHNQSRHVYLFQLMDILKIQDTLLLADTVLEEPLVQSSRRAKRAAVVSLFSDVDKLQASLDASNCFSMLKINAKHNSTNCTEVREALMDFIARNLGEIAEKPEILHLEKDEITAILKHTEPTELVKWQIMIKWIKFNQSRGGYLLEMMEIAKITGYNEPPVQTSQLARMKEVSEFSDPQRLEASANRYNSLALKKIVDDETYSALRDDAMNIINSHIMLKLQHVCSKSAFLESSFRNFRTLLPTLFQIWREPLLQTSKAVKMFVIKSLFVDLKHLEHGIDANNCLTLKSLNDLYNTKNKQEAGKILNCFIVQHLGDISDSKEFLDWSQNDLIFILKSSDARASEEKKFEAIVKWIKHGNARLIVFPQLFKLLDLKAMDTEYVRDVVVKEWLVMNSQECLFLLPGGQHPNFMIFNYITKEWAVLGLEDGRIQSVSIPIGDHGLFRGTVAAGGEVYLVTKKRILKIWSDGNTKTLKLLNDLLPSRVVSFQEKIYIIQPGGFHMLCFDPADNSLIDDLPGCGLGEKFCASSTEDFIYATGGDGTENKAKRFDHLTKTWSEIGNLRFEERVAAAATLDGKIYVVVGDGQGSTSVQQYCPNHNSWMKMLSINAPRYIFSACVFKDRVYAVSSWDWKEKMNGFLERSIVVYNKQLDRWTLICKFDTTSWNITCVWPHGPIKPDKSAGHKDETLTLASHQVTSAPAAIKEEQRTTSVAGIGELGGEIFLNDCAIIFPPDALSQQTELRTSTVDPEDDDSSDELIPISPTLQLSPNMDLAVPAEVNLQTWATSDNSEAYVYFRQNSTLPWENPRPVTLLKNGKAKFEITKFCEYRIFILIKSVLKWSFRLQSCLFGNKETKKLTNRVATDCTTSAERLKREMKALEFIPLCSVNPALSAKVGDKIEVLVHELKIEQRQEQNLLPSKITITKKFLKHRRHEVQDFPLPIESKGIVKFTHSVQLHRQDEPCGDATTHKDDRINLGLPKPPPNVTTIGKSNTGEYSATTHGESVQMHQEFHYH